MKKTYKNTLVTDLMCRGLGGGGQTHSYGGPIFNFFAWKIQKNDDAPLFPFFNFLIF